MRLRRLVLALTTVLLIVPVWGANEREGASAILRSLNFERELEVEFVQRQRTRLLKRPHEQTGFLSISASGALVMRVTAPRPEERRLEDGYLTLTRERGPARARRSVTRRVKLDPGRPSQLVLLAIEAVLLGRIDVVERHFTMKQARRDEGWELILEPKQEAARRALDRVVLTGSGDRLATVRSERDAQRGEILEIEISPHSAAAV